MTIRKSTEQSFSPFFYPNLCSYNETTETLQSERHKYMSIQTTSTREDIKYSFRDDSNIAAALDLEQQIQLVDEIIRLLRKAQRTLSSTEKKIDRINLLIGSDIGSAPPVSSFPGKGAQSFDP
jgi:hypothetical protein